MRAHTHTCTYYTDIIKLKDTTLNNHSISKDGVNPVMNNLLTAKNRRKTA